MRTTRPSRIRPAWPRPAALMALLALGAGACAAQPGGEPANAAAAAPAAQAAASSPSPQARASGHPWPESTRVHYTGRAHFHADLKASAELEWKREGGRYTMRLDMGMGPLQRRSSSQGRVDAQGLAPERYEEANRALLGRERRAAVQFDGTSVELADGQREDRPPGVQDPVSQFGQLAHLFAKQAGRSAGGKPVEFPLALPKRVSAYDYEVLGLETLDTPLGRIEALHIKPRRVEGRDKETVAEVWLAPSLDHLPVRIRISQDDDASIDLLIARPPETAR